MNFLVPKGNRKRKRKEKFMLGFSVGLFVDQNKCCMSLTLECFRGSDLELKCEDFELALANKSTRTS